MAADSAAAKKMTGKEKNQGDHKDVSIDFPPTFLCGTAINVFQNSGDPNSNWAWFENQKKIETNLRLRLSLGSADDRDGLDENHGGFAEIRWEKLGPPVIEKGYKIGISSDFWNRYEEDIGIAKELGCNSFRLSLEWSRIYPQRGVIDQSAVDRYHQMFDCLDRHKMQSNVTLYWFVLPKWFMDMGGFEKEENIKEFVNWGRTAFELFGKRSKLWATINEPGVAAMCGYIVGNHPPGKKGRFKTAGRVLCNILRGHKRVYDAIKSAPGGANIAIGIVHNVFWLEPKGSGWKYAHVRKVLDMANQVWGNEVVMDFLREGRFEHSTPVPGQSNTKYIEPDGKPGCDFIGVNHYARAVVNWMLQPDTKGEKGGLSQMDYPVYPPSLYRSISYASTLGVPIYIMENGIPAAKDDPSRRRWIEGCLQQVKNAIDDGFDVRGYMYWTLIDNFEWNFAWILEFGLYEFVRSEGNPGGERRMKKGTEALKEWYETEGPKLTKLLERRVAQNGNPMPVKPESERRRLEESREREFLKAQGVPDADLPKLTSQFDPAEHGIEGERYQQTEMDHPSATS